MKPKCRVVRTEYSSGGFEQILRQEKTVYEVSTQEGSDAAVTCFEEFFPDWGYDYVKQGGIALVSGARKQTFSFDSGFVCRAGIEYADLSFCGEGQARVLTTVSVFAGEGIGSFTLHEKRPIWDKEYPGFYPLFLCKKLGKGEIWYTGLPMAALLTCEGTTLRRTNSAYDFDERIVSIDKQKISTALKSILKTCFKRAGVPYCSISAFPKGYRSVFAYRIDADGLLSEGVNQLNRCAQMTDTKFTFCISKSYCETDPDAAAKLRETAKYNRIVSHAGKHNALDTVEENLQDACAFEEWMASMGILFEKQFAPPRGMYCANLGRALQAKGYRHTTDFGLSVDDFPFFPMIEGEQVGPLLIPVDGYNVCRLIKKHEEEGKKPATPEEVLQHYIRLTDEKLSKGLPLLFFCHPQFFGLIAEAVYPKLVEYVRERNVYLTDCVEYGDFWLRRDSVDYGIEECEEGWKITGALPEEFVLCVDGCPAKVSEIIPKR